MLASINMPQECHLSSVCLQGFHNHPLHWPPVLRTRGSTPAFLDSRLLTVTGPSPCLQDAKAAAPTRPHDERQRPAKDVLPEELPDKPLQDSVAETEPLEEHSPAAEPESPKVQEPWGQPQHSPAAELSSPESPELDGATAALAVLEDTAAALTQQLPLKVSCAAPT